jgi:hypothetical protein
MTRKSVLSTGFIFLLVFSFVFVGPRSLEATPVPGNTPDIIIKINDFEKNLELLKEVFGPGDQQSLNFLRQMLFGTEWIDPERAIVFGVYVEETQSRSAVLIPFRQPNPDFQSQFNASNEKDAYVVAFPTDQPLTVSTAFKNALKGAARSKDKSFISVEIGVQKLMVKGEKQIREMLMQIENMPQNEQTQDMPMSPREAREMMEGMLDTFAQLETLSISFDLTQSKMSLFTEARAAGGTELAKLFIAPQGPSVLGNFSTAHDINFRSRSYDYSGMMALIENTFGSIYKQMGIDFTDIAALMENYTGEMAGGLSFGQDSFRFEGIDVLKDPKKANSYIEKVYLPWIEKFSQSMAAKVGELSGEKIENPFTRTKTSTVSGYKVYGGKFILPQIVQAGPDGPAPLPPFLRDFEWRFTTVGRYFVYATNDAQLAKMIKKAKTLKPRAVKGPLFTMDMDMGSYLQFITAMVPQASEQFQGKIPKLGKMYMTFDFQNGKVLSSTSMGTKDIKKMVAYFSQGAMGAEMEAASFDEEDQDQDEAEQDEVSDDQPEKKADDRKEKAIYWFKKGALCATYGNNQVAIKYFEKTVALDPQHSGAYFEQGVSYGQLGDYQKGVSMINQALAMEPGNGLYYYGRGRVYLLSGDKDRAMEDFKKAAHLEDEDVINYLKYIEETSN